MDLPLDIWVRSVICSDLTCPTIFSGALSFFIEIFPEVNCLHCTDLRTAIFRPLTVGVGVLGPNICMNLPGVDVVLHSKFQPLGTNGVATKSMRARIPLLYRFHINQT